LNVIVTTQHAVLVVEIPSGEILETLRLGGTNWHYSGVTWTDDHLFIACRNRCCHKVFVEQWNHDLSLHADQMLPEANSIHQMIWDEQEQRLWTANAGSDRIIGYRKTLLSPLVFEFGAGRDQWHINSVWCRGGDYLYVTAHNRDNGPSELWILNKDGLKLSQWTLNRHAHNGCVLGQVNVWLDSLDSRINEGELSVTIREEHYLRGLAITDTARVVGGSQHTQARKIRRLDREAWLHVLDDEWQAMREPIELHHGQIYDIRALDEPDLAHHCTPWTGRYGA